MKNILNICCGAMLITSFAVMTSGCLKLTPKESIIESPAGVIPEDFDWKTITDISCTVRVNSAANVSDNMLHIIKIFNSPLLNDGALIASGATRPGSPYNVKISLATATPTIYVQEISPDGFRAVKAVKVSGSSIDVTFSQVLAANAPITKSSPSFTPPAIAIPTNYDVEIQNNKSLYLTGFSSGESSAYGNTYKSYLIPAGFTRTADINTWNFISHAILYVKGTFTFTKSSKTLDNVTIVVLNGGRVEFKGIYTGNAATDIVTVYVEKGGTLVTTGEFNFSNGRSVVNKGTMTMTEDFDINNYSKVYNEGEITVQGSRKDKSLLVTNNSSFYNSGSILCDKVGLSSNGSLLNDSGASLETKYWDQGNTTVTDNYGHIVATTQFTTAGGGEINNYCSIVSNVASLQGSTNNFYDGSIFNCQHLSTNNTYINMYGGSMLLTGEVDEVYGMKVKSSSDIYSVFKCTGNIPDMRYAVSEFNGKIEVVHSLLTDGTGANGRGLYSASFHNGSILSKTQTQNIPATTCNDAAGQIVTPPDPDVDDKDGDGVASESDVDDNDATVAFVSYFPDANTWGTYAFEDMWPLKGDYDVNDMVLGFRIAYYTNASNLVTKLKFDYNLKAAGSAYSLAAAFQLDKVQSSNIASVTNQNLNGSSPFSVNTNGTENGPALAVIPFLNSLKDAASYTGYLNTQSESYVITADKSLTVNFVTPVQQTDVSMSAFNMFITVNGRGCEVHLPSYKATSKFDALLTVGKYLDANDYFKNYDGMMWGLMIPETFLYPVEGKTIIAAYLHFAEWATSGGTSYPDWYKQKEGYTNEALIFEH